MSRAKVFLRQLEREAGLLAASADAGRERKERRLQPAERRDGDVARFDEQGRRIIAVDEAPTYVPREPGLGALSGSAHGGQRELHTVDADPAEQVSPYSSRRPEVVCQDRKSVV